MQRLLRKRCEERDFLIIVFSFNWTVQSFNWEGAGVKAAERQKSDISAALELRGFVLSMIYVPRVLIYSLQRLNA